MTHTKREFEKKVVSLAAVRRLKEAESELRKVTRAAHVHIKKVA